MYLIFFAITAIPDCAITDLGLVDCVTLEVVSPIAAALDGAASRPPTPVV
jgi:adenine deaminase